MTEQERPNAHKPTQLKKPATSRPKSAKAISLADAPQPIEATKIHQDPQSQLFSYVNEPGRPLDGYYSIMYQRFVRSFDVVIPSPMFTKTGLMSKGLMQGIWKTKFLVADEGLDYAETYKDGLLNGLFTVYSANRTIHYQTVIENGTGVWKSFYSNGKLELTGMYKNGREHGTWVRYTRTGQTEEQLVFEHGIVLRTVSPPAK